MVRNCCVPLCSSKRGMKGISLHEIPSNLELRKIWLRIISRADSQNPRCPWQPGSSSAVCSRHFVDSDYQQQHKQSRLKPDAIPTLFPEYPTYKLPSISTRKAPRSRIPLPVPTKRRKMTTKIEPADSMEVSNPADQAIRDPTTSCDVMKGLEAQVMELTKKVKLLKVQLNRFRCLSRRKNSIISKLLQDKMSLKRTPQFKAVMEDSIKKIEDDADNGDMKALILLQQIQAYGKKRYRWSELCLRMCVLWKGKSPRAYRFARLHFVNLPCPSTLQNYIGPSRLETGITELAQTRLQEELTRLSDCDKYCSLIFDEMSIQPRLQLKRQADKLIGFAENGDHKATKSSQLANKLLCFVLKGLATNYRIPVAYYLVRDLCGLELSKLILKVLTRIEEIGYTVCRLVCDDASSNVKALEYICGGQIQHKIIHPVRHNEPLFISFDSCHVLKNIRNQFIDDDREWENNRKPISSKSIKQLYECQRQLPIQPVRFLSRKALFPTNFEKMNVRRAIDIFSAEVIAALKFCASRNLSGFRNLDETIKFMEFVEKWFAIHNVCNRTHYLTARNEDKRHFWGMDDCRLEWLQNVFLRYLDNWKEYADKLPRPRGRQKSRHFLTKETYSALKITTMSTIECIRYLIGAGFRYVLTRKFTSDDIERIFSSVRGAQGYNDQANAASSVYALENLLKTGIFSSAGLGNSGNNNGDGVDVAFKRRNMLLPALPVAKMLHLSPRQERLATKFQNPPVLSCNTVRKAGIAMVAGFLLRLLKDRHMCPHSTKNYLGSFSDSSNKLIYLQDRGGLTYPSKYFVGFVALVVDILKLADLRTQCDALVKSWKLTLRALLPSSCLECGCGDSNHSEMIKDMVLGSLCKIYFTNASFNINDDYNQTSRFSCKPMSGKVKKL